MGLITSTISNTMRALKFLREAETRGKELNDAEKLALKQGIERAQRGLREASDAESPYAMSERSRHHNGFNPAKPESQVASTTNPLNPPARQVRHRIGPPKNNLLGSEGEDQGEPIRLASGEVAFQQSASFSNQYQPPLDPDHEYASRSDQPARLPEIPKLPTFRNWLIRRMPVQCPASVAYL